MDPTSGDAVLILPAGALVAVVAAYIGYLQGKKKGTTQNKRGDSNPK